MFSAGFDNLFGPCEAEPARRQQRNPRNLRRSFARDRVGDGGGGAGEQRRRRRRRDHRHRRPRRRVGEKAGRPGRVRARCAGRIPTIISPSASSSNRPTAPRSATHATLFALELLQPEKDGLRPSEDIASRRRDPCRRSSFGVGSCHHVYPAEAEAQRGNTPGSRWNLRARLPPGYILIGEYRSKSALIAPYMVGLDPALAAFRRRTGTSRSCNR